MSGVGVEKDDTGEYVLAVHLDSNNPAAGKGMPDEIDGCPVRYIRSGPFQKLSAKDDA